MASIKKRGKTWYVRFSKRETRWDQKKQKNVSVLRQKSKGGFKTKAEAQEYGIKMEAASLSGVDVVKNPAFADYCDKWIKIYKLPSVRPATKLTYNKRFKYIKQFFGTTKIKDIDRTMYQKFINWYGEDHATSSTHKMNILVKSCVFAAIDDGLISRNFTNQITIHGNDDKTKKIEYLNEHEIKALVSELKTNLQPRYTSNYLILAGLYTGARLGELSALHWSDIDFKHKTISITKSWNQDRKEMGKPKTKNSVRKIPVNDEILNIISQLKANHFDFVFATSRTKMPPTACAVNDALKRNLSKAGITKQGYHFHSLRHTHVAYLISHHVDIYSISRRLGHAKISTTLDIYAQLLKEYKNNQNDKIIKSLNQL